MIYKFQPLLKETIWGGTKIAKFKGINAQSVHVGESWEISGVKGNESIVADGPNKGLTLTQLVQHYKADLLGTKNYQRFGDEFPLLIKFIDASQDLSIQVHPNDALASERHNSKGKTEMWYVVDAAPEAHLRSGFKTQMTPDEYVKSINDNTICDNLTDYKVKAGDVFFLPAGRIHSIGAGCFIAEIQQTSDITYRIYDFMRKDNDGNYRQLHTELAKDAIDYTVHDNYRTLYNICSNDETRLVDCPYFNVSLCEITEGHKITLPSEDSFTIIIGVEGKTLIETEDEHYCISQGETVLIPAKIEQITLTVNQGVAKNIIAKIL